MYNCEQLLKREGNSKAKKLKVFGQDNTLLSAHHSKIRNPFVFDQITYTFIPIDLTSHLQKFTVHSLLNPPNSTLFLSFYNICILNYELMSF